MKSSKSRLSGSARPALRVASAGVSVTPSWRDEIVEKQVQDERVQNCPYCVLGDTEYINCFYDSCATKWGNFRCSCGEYFVVCLSNCNGSVLPK